jgi:hypothetical protein
MLHSQVHIYQLYKFHFFTFNVVNVHKSELWNNANLTLHSKLFIEFRVLPKLNESSINLSFLPPISEQVEIIKCS